MSAVPSKFPPSNTLYRLQGKLSRLIFVKSPQNPRINMN